ncbi:hypothetical protein [Lentzea sp.]|uniref:hypothetical protein n=1 Tax=Lentzea sp. TaxID=56099 RepID=UPI002CBC6671|nr:hypothetical protein [Lentzea sp.]HUQ59370.1 hypothetical protein [Lentzea sp.]
MFGLPFVRNSAALQLDLPLPTTAVIYALCSEEASSAASTLRLTGEHSGDRDGEVLLQADHVWDGVLSDRRDS